jgi:hypothetical protein
MTANPAQHTWSPEALFNKALLYVGEMQRYTADDWHFAFWSSLSLEMVARAAVAHISPTLLAAANRGDGWRNVYHALGHQSTKKGFRPNSAMTNEVLSILKEVLTDFTQELVDFCITHCARRNAELHSGEDAFTGLGTSTWLPKYYASCDVLLRSMGKSLSDLFDNPKTAQDLIGSLKDTAAKAVEKDIEIHKQIWENKSAGERQTSLAQAVAWATRRAGHRVKCPACDSPAILRGSGQGAVTTEVGLDEVVQRQTMLPSSFECVACGLKISGLSRLSASGLGDAFTSTSTTSPADFFGLHTEDELEQARAESGEPQWEEDFNEYFTEP